MDGPENVFLDDLKHIKPASFLIPSLAILNRLPPVLLHRFEKKRSWMSPFRSKSPNISEPAMKNTRGALSSSCGQTLLKWPHDSLREMFARESLTFTLTLGPAMSTGTQQEKLLKDDQEETVLKEFLLA
ncbi:hypothetical protein RRG08_037044 [Elysia crispata]|uniref:Uncharacterized protein n=1 Tax=Elysia crispata TaxID=231223 RepID=A0AAE0YA37_9GAST|nr:hypothetical protein RRG08_037044 [Elysia crispata]